MKITRGFIKFFLFLFMLVIITSILAFSFNVYKNLAIYALVGFLFFLVLLLINKRSPLIGKSLIAIFVLVVLLLILASFIPQGYFNAHLKNSEFVNVTRVISGDSFEIGNNQIIKLFCVHAPEINESEFRESRVFLKDLVMDKSIRIEKDVANNDSEGRLLRYVYVTIDDKEIFVNKEVVSNNFSKFENLSSDSRCSEISRN